MKNLKKQREILLKNQIKLSSFIKAKDKAKGTEMEEKAKQFLSEFEKMLEDNN